MTKITCFPDNKIIEAHPNKTFLENLLSEDVPHTDVCGGQGNCSTCRVMILEGIDNCSKVTPLEIALAERLDFPFHVRLACQSLKLLPE
ncbi:2Fe-2S iron-sulfur cluster-binding protein [Synechocystis salina]|uniref:(2Fe-2S)-binding protein n=1 Tax=Synechocystis salina LEGE 00031 TaxID=1828736 RepID=A0ABR9VR51_9SYNC|nr:2Fe-2S iron-sulfur cluster-binding protein [Synechocystis salina]MBE9242927.1 (2Fe-2S)-binding protein [Synechocystis salina LEGE 00041]MBE9253824.1 (2Fe-2S)-binding protein [Synechocystis salina LEGE 00031]